MVRLVKGKMSSIENRIHSLSAADNVFSTGNALAKQVRARIAELAKTVDAGRTTAVKLYKDGTYEITSESKGADAERVKSEIAKTFADDEKLTSLTKEYQSQYQAMQEKKSEKSIISENKDTAEISDEARAMLEQTAANRQQRVNDGQRYQFTMKIDMEIVEANEPPISLANRYFFRFNDELQSAAQETGDFENDFVIKFNEKSELYIAEATGRSGAVKNEKTATETSRIESFLESINEAMKNDAGENNPDLVKTLRRFMDAAARAEASQTSGLNASDRLYRLPFTILGSTTRG